MTMATDGGGARGVGEGRLELLSGDTVVIGAVASISPTVDSAGPSLGVVPDKSKAIKQEEISICVHGHSTTMVFNSTGIKLPVFIGINGHAPFIALVGI